MLHVLVADDHDWFRAGVVDVLTASGDMQVVAECSDGAEVLPAYRRTRPHVVVLDVAMPVMDGLRAAAELLSEQPSARVLMLSGSAPAAHVSAARSAGAAGYLLKDGDPDALPEFVRAVAAGGSAWQVGD